ncbi:U3 small nucleolar RNA-associated protein 18 homolog [Ischnura elegans]|uniref:U3 small nucleolar RNA-associated protein 18 homolog n=1 Tax=Ischnura elegans TaxID=197161 RepID=UPI001ED88F09|nr:U3 small nucleolar RNA-associated protein 18 homolog [Ischnura elegans]
MDEVLSVRRKRKNSEECDQNVFGSNSKAKTSNMKKLKRLTEAEKEEEARLEKLVFGESSLADRRREQPHHGVKDMSDLDSGLEEGDELLFGDGEAAMDIITASEDKVCQVSSVKKDLRPAWEDDEDPPPRRTGEGSGVRWARLSGGAAPLRDSSDSDDEHSADSDDGDDDDLLRHCGELLHAKKAVAVVPSSGASQLPSGVLRFRKANALNRVTHVEGPLITSVQFHPTSTVAAVAGVSGVASIVEVDGRNNAKLASIQFERFPIHCARFSSNGSELLVGSRSHAHLYSYDLIEGRTTRVLINRALGITNAKNFEVSPDGERIALAGRWGEVHILSARAKEWISTLQMTGEVNCMSFSHDGAFLYTYGESGQVWVWSMSSLSCTHRFVDEGSLAGSALAISPCSRFIACGCTSGHVNLYQSDDALKMAVVDGVCKPSPLCTISNLVTPVTSLKFDPSSELLFMASSEKADAARMLHVAKRTVFTNFPGRAPGMERPLCADISPHGGYLSIGSSKGTAFLYRLSHFGSY